MTAVRWQLPHNPLRVSVISTQAIAMAAVALASVSARAAGLPVGGWYPVKAMGVFTAMMIVALGRVREHHPHESFGPANQITTGRAALVALVTAAIGELPSARVAECAAALALLATALDGVDGWVARRTRMMTAFGARFDMEIDALLVQVLAILVWQHDKAGAWIIASGLLRYLFVAAGWRWDQLRQPLFPSLRRKMMCVVQIVGLVLAMVPAITPPLSTAIAAIGLVGLGYSFLVDTVWLWRR
jgi:phosphatidylglycerophosphate synthase